MVNRVMVFIDARNILIAARSKYNSKIDWLKLRELLAENRDLRKSYYFDAEHPNKLGSTKAFYTFLRANGFKVITKQLKNRVLKCDTCKLGKKLKSQGVSLPNKSTHSAHNEIDVPYQKGVDVALATELLRMARENVFDTAIIVSGDNDFAAAVECVSTMGKTVEVASFNHTLGAELKEKAERLWILDRHISKIKR